jgi:hypothetical protein
MNLNSSVWPNRSRYQIGDETMNGYFLNDLQTETEIFFNLHWPREEWNDVPKWNEIWYFKGEMKGNNKQGVYALLNKDLKGIYIGVGASFGGRTYEGFGLGSRTGRYSRVAPDQRGVPISERRYVPSKEWEGSGLSAIATFGFEPIRAYLAYGLEAYLLSKISTEFNTIRAARRKNL